MKLREQLLKEHSKSNCSLIVNWIGDSQQRFDELFALLLSEDPRLVQRAAWPLSYVVVAHPSLIKKHLARLLKLLASPGIHNAVKRNTVRLLQEIPIPKKFQGEVMNLCFGFISSPEEPAAIKAFSLTVLEKLSQQYPDIQPELKTIIEDRWDYETAAFHARARKILRRLK